MSGNIQKIPKKIHYCWFGKGEIPPLNKACMETWGVYLEEYAFKRWDETNCPKNLFIEYHLEQGNWAFVSDYVRLYALYTEGGIYLDTDFEVVKEFDNLLDNSAFAAWESDEHINNAIAGSVKGNSFFNDCMKYMLNRHRQKESYHTSPVVTTNVYNTKNYNVKIYDKELFYPYNPYDSSRKIKVLMQSMLTKETYAIHHWAKSWDLKKRNKGTGLCVLLKTIASKLNLVKYMSVK